MSNIQVILSWMSCTKYIANMHFKEHRKLHKNWFLLLTLSNKGELPMETNASYTDTIIPRKFSLTQNILCL